MPELCLPDLLQRMLLVRDEMREHILMARLACSAHLSATTPPLVEATLCGRLI